MEKIDKYNPTCIITGKRDNLLMYAHRNKNGEMVGWIFIHESINISEIIERSDDVLSGKFYVEINI
jgi:hypothetical protein